MDDFWEWHKHGMDKGWVSEVYCGTHDGPPMTDEEMEAWDDGEDPCMFEMRMWD